MQALKAGRDDITEDKVFVRRSCGILPYARWLLANHAGECKPQCVQGNMLDRLPARLLNRLRRLHAKHTVLAKYQFAKLSKPMPQTPKQKKKKGCKANSLVAQRKTILENQGRKFVRQAAKFILQGVEDMSPEDIANIKAHCDVHGKECPSLPKVPKHFRGLLGRSAGLT